MKKIYAILTAALCLSVGAKAQRSIDLSVTMSAPTASSTITSGQPFSITGVITNAGANTLQTTDSVVYYFTVDGNPITTTSNGQTVLLAYFRTNKQMATNDTIQVNKSLNLTFSSSLNGAHQFCLVAIPYNTSVDSVKDNVTTNNSGCANATFTGGTPTSVNTITAEEVNNQVTNVFPNPATNNVNIDMDLSFGSDVTVRVLDLMGRTVMTTESHRYGKGKQTISLNTTGLNNGLYLYQVVMGGNVSSGKLYISK